MLNFILNLKRKVPIKVVKVKLLRDTKHFSVWQLLVCALVFGLIGGYIVHRSSAFTTPEPTAFIISDDIVPYGVSPTLTYSATNATSCSINGARVSTADGDNFYMLGAATTSTTYTLSCNGPGGTVNASTRVNVAPPLQTTSSTVPTHRVNFIKFCGNDGCSTAQNEPSLESVKTSVRNWYTRKVGKSFYVGSINLKVVRGNHSARWYRNTGGYIDYAGHIDTTTNTWYNVSNFLNNNGYVPAGNIDAVVLGFPTYAYCGVGGVGDNVSITDPFKCTGAAVFPVVAHELGHNFGLKHDNTPSGAICAQYSPRRNNTLMDCYYSCNGQALSNCELNGRAYHSNIPDWKVLANTSPYFH